MRINFENLRLSEEEKSTLFKRIWRHRRKCKNCKHKFYFHYNRDNGAWGYFCGCHVIDCKCTNKSEYWEVR